MACASIFCEHVVIWTYDGTQVWVWFLLPFRRHRAAPYTADPSVFACISMLARAASAVLFNEMKQLLENMLAVGLSQALTQCLRVVAEEIPKIRRDIQGVCSCVLPHVCCCFDLHVTSCGSRSTARKWHCCIFASLFDDLTQLLP